MLEPPDLPDEAIVTALRDHYGIPVVDLAFLPLGRDYAAWTYRAVDAGGTDFFVKLRAGAVNDAGLIVPRYLRDHGVTEVVAPIATRGGALRAGVDGYALILYPFIDGENGTDHGMAERHWTTYGAALARMHAVPLDAEIRAVMRRDDFAPAWLGRVERLDAHISGRTFADSIEREAAAFWHERRAQIRALLERTVALGRRLRAARPPVVLCHTDIHTWNLMIDRDDRLWVVDWDEAAIAPKECDLMFVVGGLAAGLVGPEREAWFFAGYGEAAIDPLALAYYRHFRAGDEVRSYGEQIFLAPEAGEASRQESVQGLIDLFAPGGIADQALADMPEAE